MDTKSKFAFIIEYLKDDLAQTNRAFDLQLVRPAAVAKALKRKGISR
jgi:hypothetical protein